jgi:hypothetical protein
MHPARAAKSPGDGAALVTRPAAWLGFSGDLEQLGAGFALASTGALAGTTNSVSDTAELARSGSTLPATDQNTTGHLTHATA